MLGTLVLVLVVGMTFGVRAAALTLSGALVILAGVRWSRFRHLVPRIRSTSIDVITLCVLATALAYFGMWGDTPNIVQNSGVM
ncbi:hypothetical protein JOD55_000877 [Arcanobacterium pluranimalium]|uniref:hypothetical protein n=1 Tax=Arcanobacterium pluranimalium TaxID=108028 RepID=UPI00195B4457|nr:hypothetical protein [Arcanobacterium pluranimalium]MBM7825050.1 hypothetical protein [Arcanobacterium pluranimalium]